MTKRCRILRLIAFSVSLFFCAPAWAGEIVADDLAVFLTFDEGSGTSTADLSENGNDATVGGGSWGVGYYQTNGGVIRVPDSLSLRSNSFTIDVWVRHNGTPWDVSNPRVFSLESGSTRGAELFVTFTSNWVGGDLQVTLPFRYALRVHNNCATLAVPTVGTRTGAAPPDHWGQSNDGVPTTDQGAYSPEPQHLVFIKDADANMVYLYTGAEDGVLSLQYEGAYTELSGGCPAANDGIRVANTHRGDDGLPAQIHQVAFYTRALDLHEVNANHSAGIDASLPGPAPDGGVPQDGGDTDGGLKPDGGTSTVGGGDGDGDFDNVNGDSSPADPGPDTRGNTREEEGCGASPPPAALWVVFVLLAHLRRLKCSRRRAGRSSS